MIKNRSFDSKFTKKLIKKHEPKKIIKVKIFRPKNIMSLGGVFELGGYYKDKFENFFGISLPKIRIHNGQYARNKAKFYHAYSYAQGNNIYLGAEVKPLDTLEGQTTLAHELTHVLQQKYLDMSSSKEMIDPSVLLEQKAKVVEDRVRQLKGIDNNSGEYFRKWNVLPQRSYQARSTSFNRFSQSKIVQRWGWLDKIKKKASGAVSTVGGAISSGVNSAVSLGKGVASGVSSAVKYSTNLATKVALKGAKVISRGIDSATSLGKRVSSGVSSALKYSKKLARKVLSKGAKVLSSGIDSAVSLTKGVASGVSSATKYTTGLALKVASKSLDVVGADKYAKVADKWGTSVNKSASKDFQSMTTNISKSAKQFVNVGTRIVGKQDAFSQQNIDKTKGISTKDISNFALEKYNRAKKWALGRVSSIKTFMLKHKDTLIEGGLLALNISSAIGKVTTAIGLGFTGVGLVGSIPLITSAVLDLNEAWKSFNAMITYASTDVKDRKGNEWKDGVPATSGIIGSIGNLVNSDKLKNFDKNVIESRGVKAFHFVSGFFVPTAGVKNMVKSGTKLKTFSQLGKLFKDTSGAKFLANRLKNLGSIKGGFKNLIGKGTNFFKNKNFSATFKNVKEFVKNKGISNTLGKWGKNSKDFFKNGGISKTLGKWGKNTKEFLKNGGISKTFGNIKNYVKSSKIGKLGTKVKEFFKNKGISKTLGKWGKNTKEFLKNGGISKTFGNMKNYLKSSKIGKIGIKAKEFFKNNGIIKSLGKGFTKYADIVSKIDFGASMMGLSNVGSQLMHGAWGKENKAVLPDKLSKDSKIKDLILYSYGDLETENGKETNERLFGKKALELDLHNQKPKAGSKIHPSMQRLMDKGEENDPIFSIDEGIGLQGVLFRKTRQESLDKYNTSYKVIFRGTDSLQDGLVEDAGKRGTRQAKRAKEIYRGFFTRESSLIDIHNKNKKNPQIGYQDLIFGGHSLGGYVANSVMIDYLGSPSKYGTLKPSNIKSETYNALGVTTKELDTYNSLVSKDGKLLNSKDNVKVSSTNYRMAFDPVSKIGVQPGTTIEQSLKHSTLKDKASVLYGGAHSMTNFYKTLDEKESKSIGKAGVVEKYVTDNPITRNLFEKAYNLFNEKPVTPSTHTSQNYKEVKKNLIKTAEQITIPSVDGTKHAEEGRHKQYGSNKDNTIEKTQVKEDVNIDELSMKIFRTLKSELALDFSRKG